MRRKRFTFVAMTMLSALAVVSWMQSGSRPAATPPEATHAEVSPQSTASDKTSDARAVMDTRPHVVDDGLDLPPIRRIEAQWSPIETYPDAVAARDALLPAAQAGDVHAMVALARSLARCRDGVGDPQIMTTLKRSAAAAGEVIPESFDEIAAQEGAYCDIPAHEAVDLYRHWLLKAADNGDAEAELYAIFNPPLQTDFVSWTLAHRSDPAVTPWTEDLERQLGYAQDAARRGEIQAVAWLTRLPSSDGINDNDAVTRYENAVLLDEVSRASGRKPQDYLLSNRSRGLLPVVMQMAQQRAHDRFLATPEWIDRPVLTPEQRAAQDKLMAKAQAEATAEGGAR